MRRGFLVATERTYNSLPSTVPAFARTPHHHKIQFQTVAVIIIKFPDYYPERAEWPQSTVLHDPLSILEPLLYVGKGCGARRDRRWN